MTGPLPDCHPSKNLPHHSHPVRYRKCLAPFHTVIQVGVLPFTLILLVISQCLAPFHTVIQVGILLLHSHPVRHLPMLGPLSSVIQVGILPLHSHPGPLLPCNPDKSTSISLSSRCASSNAWPSSIFSSRKRFFCFSFILLGISQCLALFQTAIQVGMIRLHSHPVMHLLVAASLPHCHPCISPPP